MDFNEIKKIRREKFPVSLAEGVDLSELSIVIIGYNQKNDVKELAVELMDFVDPENIYIVDNGSTNGTNEMLNEIGLKYVYFDEGMQPYSRVFNIMCKEFELNEHILFVDAGYRLDRESLIFLVKTLKTKNGGAAGMIHDKGYPPYEIKDDLAEYDNICSKSLGVFGYGFGINKSAYEAIGDFCEDIVDPEYVMVDYSFRMLDAGYDILISENSLVRYVGNGLYLKDAILGKDDRETLTQKYGMKYFNRGANPHLLGVIRREKNEAFSILEVGCDLGATLLEIKRKYVNSQVYGLDINENAVDIASKILDVKYGNIEEHKIPFDMKFDYIMFGDVLEHLRDPGGVLEFCKTILNPGGRVIACIPNLMNITVMEDLIKNGNFTYTETGLLDRTHIHFFTYFEVVRIFEENGYQIETLTAGATDNLTESQMALINKLVELSDTVSDVMYIATHYIVSALA